MILLARRLSADSFRERKIPLLQYFQLHSFSLPTSQQLRMIKGPDHLSENSFICYVLIDILVTPSAMSGAVPFNR
jgi:hypothetical protein